MKKYIFLLLTGLNIFLINGMKRKGEDFFNNTQDLFNNNNKKRKTSGPRDAIKNCDYNEFKQWIEEGVDVNQEYQNKPLFFNILDTLDTLRIENIGSILYDADIESRRNSIDKNNEAMKELHNCLKLLIAQEAFNVNCVNESNQSALEVLVWRNMKKRYNSASEKMVASIEDDFIARSLLKKGIFLGPYKDGKTPLHYIVLQEESTKRHLKMAEMFVQYGINIDSIDSINMQGNTALHLCCDNFNMVLLLLALGAQYDKKNHNGQTAAELSVNKKVIDMLSNEIKREKFKKDIKDILLKNTCSDNEAKNILELTFRNQVTPGLKPQRYNLYPYTQAVLEYLTFHESEDADFNDEETHEEENYSGYEEEFVSEALE